LQGAWRVSAQGAAGPSPPEEEPEELALPEHGGDLPEGEERDEGHQHELDAGERLVSLTAGELELAGDGPVVEKGAHDVLEDPEDGRPWASELAS